MAQKGQISHLSALEGTTGRHLDPNLLPHATGALSQFQWRSGLTLALCSARCLWSVRH